MGERGEKDLMPLSFISGSPISEYFPHEVPHTFCGFQCILLLLVLIFFLLIDCQSITVAFLPCLVFHCIYFFFFFLKKIKKEQRIHASIEAEMWIAGPCNVARQVMGGEQGGLLEGVHTTGSPIREEKKILFS